LRGFFIAPNKNPHRFSRDPFSYYRKGANETDTSRRGSEIALWSNLYTEVRTNETYSKKQWFLENNQFSFMAKTKTLKGRPPVKAKADYIQSEYIGLTETQKTQLDGIAEKKGFRSRRELIQDWIRQGIVKN
jgi:hypothetical protein